MFGDRYGVPGCIIGCAFYVIAVVSLFCCGWSYGGRAYQPGVTASALNGSSVLLLRNQRLSSRIERVERDREELLALYRKNAKKFTDVLFKEDAKNDEVANKLAVARLELIQLKSAKRSLESASTTRPSIVEYNRLMKQTDHDRKKILGLEQDMKRLRERIYGFKNEVIRLRGALVRSQGEKEQIIDRLKRIAYLLDGGWRQLQEMDLQVRQELKASPVGDQLESVEAFNLVVAGQHQVRESEVRAPQDSKKVRYRIVAKNDTLQFVVINGGRDDGLKKGMMVDLFFQRKVVARAAIIDLRDKIAAIDTKEAHIPDGCILDDVVEVVIDAKNDSKSTKNEDEGR